MNTNQVYLSEVIDSLEEVLNARNALRTAQANVPDYTGDRTPADYVKDEQVAVAHAENNLYDTLNGYIDQRIEERLRK